MVQFITKMIQKYKLEEFVKFVIVGVLATGINYLIYYIFLNFSDKNIAYTVGYAISFCFNLIASNLFTFKTQVNVSNSIRFGFAHLTNYLIQIGLLNFFTFVGIPEVYAPLPVYVIAVPVNFFVVRFALKQIKQYTIRNEYLEATFINQGAAIIRLIDLKTGINIIASHFHIESYKNNPGYLNAIVGRNAGRIKDAKLFIEDKTYELSKNSGNYQLHGGFKGFSFKKFKVHTDLNKIIFKAKSPDMEDGFPGNIDLTVTYSLHQNELHLDYEAKTDKTTFLSFTNHAYFNLNGNLQDDILNHELYLNAKDYLILDDENVPEKKEAVKDTPFDFTEMKKIGRDINQSHEQLKIAGGYDHPYIINKKDEINPVATLISPITNLQLDIYSDQDAVIFYSGNFLDETYTLNEKTKGKKRIALCLETQGIPNSYHIEEYKDRNIYHPNEIYTQKTIWKLSNK